LPFAIFNVLEAGNGSNYYGRSYNPPPILISPLEVRHFQRPPDIFLHLSPANRACSDFRSQERFRCLLDLFVANLWSVILFAKKISIEWIYCFLNRN